MRPVCAPSRRCRASARAGAIAGPALLLLAALGCGRAAGSAAAGTAPPAGCRGYVTNERGASITVLDTCQDVAVATLPVAGRPRGIPLSADGRRLFVAVS